MQGAQATGRADPRSYKEAAAILNGRDRRKLANNTWLERRNGEHIAVRLHQTDVVTYRVDGTTVLDSGGWRTVTTKDRINRFGPQGARVWSDRGEWRIERTTTTPWLRAGESQTDRGDRSAAFADGVVIGPRGGVRSAVVRYMARRLGLNMRGG